MLFNVKWRRASEISQTISGTIGVLISLLGFVAVTATLVLQYKESIRNNNNLQLSREIARIETVYTNARNDIDNINLTVIRKNQDINFKGADALDFFNESLKSYKDHTEILSSTLFQNIYFACGTIDTLLTRIQESGLPEKERKYFITNLIYLYTSRLSKSLITLELLHDNDKLKIDPKHENAKMMVEAVVKLNKKMAGLMLKEWV